MGSIFSSSEKNLKAKTLPDISLCSNQVLINNHRCLFTGLSDTTDNLKGSTNVKGMRKQPYCKDELVDKTEGK